MTRENVVKSKSFAFAVRAVKLYKYLITDKREYVMAKQVLRSGTAIGALYREAEQAESKRDFIHKMAIAQKECNETLYWLELLKETEFLTDTDFNSIHSDGVELIKLITSIIKSTKQNIKN